MQFDRFLKVMMCALILTIVLCQIIPGINSGIAMVRATEKWQGRNEEVINTSDIAPQTNQSNHEFSRQLVLVMSRRGAPAGAPKFCLKKDD